MQFSRKLQLASWCIYVSLVDNITYYDLWLFGFFGFFCLVGWLIFLVLAKFWMSAIIALFCSLWQVCSSFVPLLSNLNMLINADTIQTQLFHNVILRQHKMWKPFTTDEVLLWFKQGLIGEFFLLFFTVWQQCKLSPSCQSWQFGQSRGIPEKWNRH